MGRGFPIASSLKQKLNTRSSTESELVAVDDCMPAILWTRYFLEAQGYGVQENIVYQDNLSAILLEKNGKASSSKRTKHINVRYYFVTDRIKKGDMSVEWCPTEDMTGDFMMKPNASSALFSGESAARSAQTASMRFCMARCARRSTVRSLTPRL